MLAHRYHYDGQATVDLTPRQRAVRNAVRRKVAEGAYEMERVACAVCGGEDEERLAEKDRYGLPLSVVICRRCGLIYTSPRMTAAAYARFYDQEYRRLYSDRAQYADALFQKTRRRGQKIARFLKAHGVDFAGGRVVEVGCGTGGALHYLREAFGCEVKGCDLGSEDVAYGRTRYDLDLEVGTADTLAGSGADLVIYSHVFEHVLDPAEECEHVRRLLAPGGMCYLEVPSVKAIRERYRWDFLRLLQNAHTYHFTLRSLTNLMQGNGFARVCGDEFVRSVFAPSGSRRGWTSDYEAAMRFLRRTERLRFAGTLQRAKRLGMKRGVAMLERLRIKAPVKRLLKKWS